MGMAGLGFKPSRKASGGFPQPSLGQPPKCPQCGSGRTWRDGLRYLFDGTSIQRWLCRSCGYRFSEPKVKLNIPSQICEALKPRDNHHEAGVSALDFAAQKALDDPSFPLRENVTSHGAPQLSTAEKDLNNLPFYNRKRRVRVSEGEAKNSVSKAIALTEEKSLSEKRAAGATEQTSNMKGKVIEYLWYLRRKGLADVTVKGYGYKLSKLLEAGENLQDPESVKEYLAKRVDWSQRTKLLTTIVYDGFAKWLGLTWEPPCYKPVQTYPYIPTEEEINQLIAACGRKLGTFLQLLKETGMRCGEAIRLKWTDVDFGRQLVKITPEKGSNPRILPISEKLLGMLNNLPRKNARIFPVTLTSLKTNFFITRKHIVSKLNNPRLMKISFHTLRHWKATMEYHKTKDIIHVQQLLGHRDIKSTMLYIYMEKQLFQTRNDDFHVKVAKTPEEIKALLEVGFEYVVEKDGLLFFRKRK
jgi:integrase